MKKELEEWIKKHEALHAEAFKHSRSYRTLFNVPGSHPASGESLDALTECMKRLAEAADEKAREEAKEAFNMAADLAVNAELVKQGICPKCGRRFLPEEAGIVDACHECRRGR